MGQLVRHDENEIERVLSREEGILPSSGFAASVMDAVRREAAAPPPIPFPWKRALPGLVVAALMLLLVLVAGVAAIAELAKASAAASAQSSMSLPSVLTPIFEPESGLALPRNVESAVLWAVLALLAAWVPVKLAMLFTSDEV
jgi:hypothetical protein